VTAKVFSRCDLNILSVDTIEGLLEVDECGTIPR
jgi:hypothetical protein